MFKQMSPELESALKKAIEALEFYHNSWNELLKNQYGSNEEIRKVFLGFQNESQVAILTLRKEFNISP